MAPDASKICVRLAQHPVPLMLDLKRTPAVAIKSELLSRPASPGKSIQKKLINIGTEKSSNTD